MDTTEPMDIDLSDNESDKENGIDGVCILT